MKKLAPSDFPINDLLAERWSPYAFSPQPVEEEKLNRIFEAARWAASSSNEQPWGFVVAHQGTEDFTRMAECLVEGNAWAKAAPVLVLSVARMFTASNGKLNRTAMYDTGLAVGNLLTQATEEGLIVHQMAGYHIDKARELLELPDRHEPMAMMAIGYYGDAAKLPEKLKQREAAPRVRKSATEFVFEGKWGEKS